MSEKRRSEDEMKKCILKIIIEGETRASKISMKSGIQYKRVMDILSEMMKNGLISKTKWDYNITKEGILENNRENAGNVLMVIAKKLYEQQFNGENKTCVLCGRVKKHAETCEWYELDKLFTHNGEWKEE